MLKIAVFVDGNHLFYVMKLLGGALHYLRFSDFIEKKFSHIGGHIVIRRFFTGAPKEPHEGQKKFWEKLESFGYEVIKRELKRVTRDDGTTEDKADMDAIIAYNIADSKNDFDLLVFVAGDSDYAMILDDLAKHGKKVLIISTRGIVSKELVDLTAPKHGNVEYIDLKTIRENVIFPTNGKGGAV